MVPFPQSLGAACRRCGIVQLLPSQSPALSQGLRMTRLMTAAVLPVWLCSVLLHVLQVSLHPGVTWIGTDFAPFLCDEPVEQG